MGIRITRHDERNLTVFTVSGRTEVDEQLEALRAYYADGPTAHTLWDFRGLDGPRLSTEDLHRIVRFVRREGARRPSGRTALVAATELDYGLGRMSSILSSSLRVPVEIQAFRSIEEAEAWIASAPPAAR